jgi:DnaK suppressor protein
MPDSITETIPPRITLAMITDSQRAELKALIIARIAELEESIPRLRERTAPVSPDAAIGRLSRTDSMINAGTAAIALKDSESRLVRLKNRLEKILSKDFDKCGLCGNQIEWGRLVAALDRGICPTCLASAKK